MDKMEEKARSQSEIMHRSIAEEYGLSLEEVRDMRVPVNMTLDAWVDVLGILQIVATAPDASPDIVSDTKRNYESIIEQIRRNTPLIATLMRSFNDSILESYTPPSDSSKLS